MNLTTLLSALVGAVIGLLIGYFAYAVRFKYSSTFLAWVTNRYGHDSILEPLLWLLGGALLGLAIDYIRKH